MDSLLYPLTAVVAWVAFLYKLRDLRRYPTSPMLRSFCAALASLGWAFTFGTPVAYLAVDRLVGVPNLARLMMHVGIMAFSGAVQQLLLHWTYPAEEARRRARRRAWVFLLAVLVMTVFFVLAPVDEETLEFTVRYGDAPFVGQYMVVYLGYFSVALADIMRLAWRYAGIAGRPFLRRGLRCTSVGAGFGLAYSLEKAIYLVAGQVGWSFIPAAWQENLSPLLAGPGAILVLTGLTLPGWGPRLAAVGTQLGRYRAYQRLRPLWLALYRATPEIALEMPGARPGRWTDTLRVRDLDYRLVRRVVEILDGRQALRPYLDGAVAHDAQRAGVRAGLGGDELRATVEAAVIAAALSAKVRDHHPRTSYRFPVRDGEDLAAETTWLIKVARALPRNTGAPALIDRPEAHSRATAGDSPL